MAKQIKKHSRIVLILGLILTFAVIYFAVPTGQTATVTSRSDTLSDSRPTLDSNHNVEFTTAAADGIAEGETLIVDFGGASDVFDLTGIVLGDVDLEVGDVDTNLVAAASCTVAADEFETVISAVNDNITFTRCTGDGAVAGGSTINVKVGTNADGGANQINNPAASVPDITIAGTFQAVQVTSTIKVAIIAGVTVSATVSEGLTVSVNGVTAANCPNYDNGGAPNEVATTATTVPFSTINVETFYDACQDLRVATNAGSGYSTTIQETDQLTSGANQIADGTCDGACTDSAEADWATATNNGFGYCMDDQAGYENASATADAGWGTNGCDDADTFFKTIADAGAAEAAQNIMSSAAAVSDDRSFVGFRLTVDTAQPALTYTNTIVYITTPTY
jgi:hypothetical protein